MTTTVTIAVNEFTASGPVALLGHSITFKPVPIHIDSTTDTVLSEDIWEVAIVDGVSTTLIPDSVSGYGVRIGANIQGWKFVTVANYPVGTISLADLVNNYAVNPTTLEPTPAPDSWWTALDNLVDNSVAIANQYTDEQLVDVTADVSAILPAANGYTDTKTAAAVVSANGYTDTKSAATLVLAKAYTDTLRTQLPLNVKDYGAKGDGTTDDSVAIRAAVTAAGAGGMIIFPAGTYVVSPNGTGTNNYCIPLPYGVRLLGVGAKSVIKYANGVPNNYGIIGPVTDATDCSGFFMSHLALDLNGDNNAITDPNQLGSGNRRRGVAIFAGSGITVEHCRFLNGQCTWYAEFLGQTLDNVTVDSCTFDNPGSSTVNWDHTSLYLDCARGRATNNKFRTTKPFGAVTAFELHGGVHHAEGNTVEGYIYGVDITGSQWRGPATGTVIGNSFTKVMNAINIWSLFVPGGSDGVQNFVIADNTITLDHVNRAGVSTCTAIGMNFGSIAPINGLSITGNTIRLPGIGTGSATQDQYSQAFSFIRTSATGITDRNIVIANNIVDGSVAGGVRFSLPGGTLDGVSIHDNIFRNVGQVGAVVSASRNAAILIDAAAMNGALIARNQFLDSQATHTLGGGILINPAAITDCQVTDNRIWLADGVSVINVVTTNTTGQTYVRGVTQNWTAPTGRFVRGSTFYDEATGQLRTQTAVNGQVWQTSVPGLIGTDFFQTAATLGTVTRRIPFYNAGTLIGYVPVYDAIT